jgi:hypothetical protein
MAGQGTVCGSPKSIAGASLVGLVVFMQFGNLNETAAQLSCSLGSAAGEAIGVLPSVVLAAASAALQTCVFDHQRYLQDLFQMLVSFWMLLLVIAGAVMLKARSRGKSKGHITWLN